MAVFPWSGFGPVRDGRSDRWVPGSVSAVVGWFTVKVPGGPSRGGSLGTVPVGDGVAGPSVEVRGSGSVVVRVGGVVVSEVPAVSRSLPFVSGFDVFVGRAKGGGGRAGDLGTKKCGVWPRRCCEAT